MGRVRAWIDGIRKFFLRTGYTCDSCGAELFDYPVHRLCEGCEEKLQKPLIPCELCGREKRAEGLCMDCKSVPPKYRKGVSAFVYRGGAAQLINRLKNGNAKLAEYLGEQMGERLAEACPHLQDEPLLLLSVPITEEKRRMRGFNQAELLAEGACRRLIEHDYIAETDLLGLEKRRETLQQKRMNYQQRAENVKGVYRVRNRAACKGRTVVIVDDIMTTGSTANEIAKKLLQAGVKEVYLLTAAAVPEQE